MVNIGFMIILPEYVFINSFLFIQLFLMKHMYCMPIV
jgi:hypothetical protein